MEGIVLTSPAMRVKPAYPIVGAIAPLFSVVAPKFQFKGANKRGIPVSRDPAEICWRNKVTDPLASQDLYNEAASKFKDIKLYDGFLHDLLFDPEREEIGHDISDWMEKRLGARAEKIDRLWSMFFQGRFKCFSFT
ncbi:hypothetical protein REPUB_Repub18cG0144100 [Reevesia pubescens]